MPPVTCTRSTIRWVRSCGPWPISWQGQAAVAFNQLMVRFNENAEKLRAALNGIGEQISGASTTYATEDETQQQAMSAITNALG